MSAQVAITLADLETAVPLDKALEAAGVSVSLANAADEARLALQREQPLVLVLSGGVHEPTARALAERARELEIAVLALLEPTDTEHTERVVRLGVTAVLTKPIATDELADSVQRLIERRALQRRTGIAGDSAAIQEVLVRIEQLAPVSSTVLIQGESGSGKELVAKAIHDLSPRRGQPFIAVNCAALPETLLESELFGHEKGAFTGAAERRLGRFELADRGTIFLDEIGEIPSSIQVKLLRVLENRTFFRLGGVQPIKVDVRVVAATNRNLREAVGLGEFRDDLFYRLSVLNIALPPLRERRSDIPLLVRQFVREFAAQHDRPFHGISGDAMRVLVEAPWPGNVRQLRNLVESMVVLAPGREIQASDIPPEVLEGAGRLLPVRVGGGAAGRELPGAELEFILRSLMDLRLQVEEMRRRLDQGPQRVQVIELPAHTLHDDLGEVSEAPEVVYRAGMTMAEVEKAAIEAALREHDGNRRKAAEVLGIGERTLYRKIKQFQLA